VDDRNMTLQELMRWAEKLSSIEKRQLIEKITAEMASESAEVNQPRPSLGGICADLGQAAFLFFDSIRKTIPIFSRCR